MKTGMDYFPLDVQLSDEVFAVECTHGNDGFAVIVKAWQALYQTERGEIDCSEVVRRTTLAKRANISEEQWNNIIDTCVTVGLFDREAWKERRLLTSNGVKKRIARVIQEREDGRQRVNKRRDRGCSANNSTENSTGNTTNNPTIEIERTEKRRPFPEAFLTSRFREEAYEFSEWFARDLAPASLKVTAAVRDQWALVWYHLRETDKRSSVADKETLQRAIAWARNHEFWSANFLSPIKLRRKNSDGVMFIDVFIGQMNVRKNGSAVETQNGKQQHVYAPPTLLTRGE